MENPWLKLNETEASYILELDSGKIQRYTTQQPESAKLVLESIPEPFIGNPKKAKLVLLLLNPGHSPKDLNAHRDRMFKSALFRNLQHREQDFPFYPLNPAFSGTPSAQWWIPRTRRLKEAARLGVEELSQKLLAIEWFPYHSKSSGLPLNAICESQLYSFNLVKQVLDKGVLVVRMRSKSHWEKVDQRTLRFALKNPRCGYITKGNTTVDLFERMTEALRN